MNIAGLRITAHMWCMSPELVSGEGSRQSGVTRPGLIMLGSKLFVNFPLSRLNKKIKML